MDSNSIVIVGGGLVGQTLAAKLSKDGRNVTLVENAAGKVRELSDQLDVRVIEGNGSIAETLRLAGIEEAGLVVASTNRDEVNVVVGLLAAGLFNVPRVVVRIRDPAHEESFAIVGREPSIDCAVVNPEMAAVERIDSLLKVPGALDVSSFMDGELLVAGFRIDPSSEFSGLRVSDMSLLFAGTPTLAVSIRRGSKWLIPHGEEVIQASDLVYFAIARKDLWDILSLVGVPHESRNQVMIGGASSIGLRLAQRLEKRGVRVVLIEESRTRAEYAAEQLKGALVIHGDIMDQALLEDEEIERVSTFVAVTDEDETNLVAGLLAKRLGAGRAFALVDNPALASLVGEFGIDAIISQRLITIGLTLQHIRGGGIRSGAALLEDEVEIMEVEAEMRTRLTSGPLAKVKLPRGVLVAALQRGGEIVVPGGNDTIEAGDRVLMIATADLAAQLEDYLTPEN